MSEEPHPPADPQFELARDRTGMATYRTELALDRTTLAWVRTTLSMASFGFGMVAFFRAMQETAPSKESFRLHQGAVRMGIALLLLGIVSTILAALTHWLTLRRLRRGELPRLNQWPLSLTLAVLSTVIGLAGLWAIFVR